jgi:hypothetical protein
MFIEHCPSHLN